MQTRFFFSVSLRFSREKLDQLSTFFLDRSHRFSTLVFTAFSVWEIVGKAKRVKKTEVLPSKTKLAAANNQFFYNEYNCE
ncbi:hypothetical protein LEP1GSC192_3215 [Leptospira sp. B5-022]|nr:hypothetical protein LEP1GSC192_3215 [Leptospira sp. B5-022]